MIRFALSLFALCLFGGCLDHELPPDDGTPDSFIALQRDFGGYAGWMQYDLGDAVIEGHPLGHRVMNVSRLPDPGAKTFPVGTTIVKTIEAGERKDWIMHAMVKRGGDYNARGAHGWEWFELKLATNDTPVIIWRGEQPPNGERYGCLMTACDETAPDCNQCHEAAATNDFVLADALRLDD